MSFDRLKPPVIFYYKLLGATLGRSHVCRDVGVRLDSKLYFCVEYETLISKAQRMLEFINRHSSVLHCLKPVYLSFVWSVLDYSIQFISIQVY